VIDKRVSKLKLYDIESKKAEHKLFNRLPEKIDSKLKQYPVTGKKVFKFPVTGRKVFRFPITGQDSHKVTSAIKKMYPGKTAEEAMLKLRERYPGAADSTIITLLKQNLK